jgi:hypothetical protein
MENLNIKKFKIDDLIEDKELDTKIIKTFEMKDYLSPDIFDVIKSGKYKMKKDIRDRLISVANTFIDSLDVNFFIYDIVLVGSLANYNWSEYSDVDLHILIDFTEIFDEESPELGDMIKNYFDSKKHIWNISHEIKIKKYDVELYVQDIKEENVSAGVYSVLNNEWIIIPEKRKTTIDKNKIFTKSEEYQGIIDDLEKNTNNGIDISDEIADIRKKLKKFRQSGLENGGEYSYENLVFKLLRRNGYIDKLMKLKKDVIDKKLSLSQ